ncbi:redoxin domain-containing protein [Nibribacter ruber]|uniref:Redoxin domain-containing protein n=1 Tax=Nibribacter ruber TaxID=2698458 RepID=A0A6P1P1Y4_9BACT|nr:redoxin domain-containing protein [Nibribacter ruber]QHL88062.1 redoxin domain-containing protein [Nibribacter ruber]
MRFKNIAQAILPVFFVLLLALQAQAQKTATITGKISNPVSDSALVELYTLPASYVGKSFTAALNASGEFKITVPLAEPMVAELVHGPESMILFLQPGNDLDVRVNAEDFLNSIKYKGSGANENTYLVQFELKFEEEEDYQVLPNNVYKKEGEFLQFLEERRQDQKNFFEKYVKKTPVSEAFKNYAKAQMEYSYANDRLTYVEVRNRVGGLTPKLSASYYDYLKKMDLNLPGATRNQAYLDFLINYFQFKALGDRRGNVEKDYYPIMYKMVKEELKGPAKDMMMSRIISQSARFGYIPDTDAMFADFKKQVQDPQYLTYVQNQYKQYQKVGMGSQAPDFTLLSASGDSISLQHLKGKLVYLGFWRPLCGICQVDQQAYKYFVNQLAEKGITFVQVTVGEELANWKKTLQEKNYPGMQLYSPDMEDQVVRAYEVKNFPSYFLISPEGTIIKTNARRPGYAEGAREIAHLVDQYRDSRTK